MSKILLISDIHIFDYTNRCPSNRFRLYQTRLVAKNIVEVAKREGCEYLAVLGDLIDRPVLHPTTQYEVKLFIDTMANNFKYSWYLRGQHDKTSKSNESTMDDSVLSVMIPKNGSLADKTIVEIEGTRIGFYDWRPKPELESWVDENNPLDILMTHATINYGDSDAFESQELDVTRFRYLAFCGDIHKKQKKILQVPADRIGNGTRTIVSLGVPVRNKLGDSEESSGVILDLTTKKWDWVNLNPHDNLLKYAVTNNLEEEGYHKNINTWFIYKPDNFGFGSSDQNVKIDTWSEVESLINNAVTKSGLQGIHSEVLKNIGNLDDSEVDFGFELKSLHLENWRSITNATIKFNKGDKIYLAGSNGSGKSSLLSGLQYAFMDVSSTQGLLSLKPFIQYGKSYCLTEVEFDYQGNSYKLRRGTNTKDNSLWINGEEQKYNNKRAFEEDVRNRFKFIEFLSEALLFNSEHHRFIGALSPERKNLIISKFLKLDRIDILNETSQTMLDNLKKERAMWASKISETEKLIGYIQEKLQLITLPNLTKLQLESLRQEGLELQRKNRLWNEYMTRTASLQGKIQTYTGTLGTLQEKQKTFRDPEIIDLEIDNLNSQIQDLNRKLVDLGNIRVNLDFKTREYEKLRDEGNNYWKEARGLDINRRCTVCGQEIKNTSMMESHKQELLQKVEALKPQIQALQLEIQELTKLKDNSAQEYNQINSDIQKLNSDISSRMTEKSLIEHTKKDIENYTQFLSQAESELRSLGVVEKVELPVDFMDRMAIVDSGINSWTQYESNKQDLDVKTAELNTLTAEIQKIDEYGCALESYNKLTGPTGVIYEAIINKLKDTFSDNTVTYSVTRTGRGNREHLSLTPAFKKGKEEIEYFSCSSGEKTLLDVHLLDKLITSAGILILDETLKNLDPDRLSEVLSILSEMNVNLLILTSHSESISGFYNRVINLSINDEGLTVIE